MQEASNRQSSNVPQLDRSAQRDSNNQTHRVAHTLSACCRCRLRKIKCDPGLPRCSNCERNNARCEFIDPLKNKKLSRDYVVFLQKKARQLESELASFKDDEGDVVDEPACGAAAVRIQESVESKYLGPSSGIAISRVVMQLAKQFTDVKSISEIVSDTTAQHVKEGYSQEENRLKARMYPLISNVAAPRLPDLPDTKWLLALYNLRVQNMYPFFHEPTLEKDIDAVYNGSTDPYQNYVLRMVIAIGLQKLQTEFAGLADSFYLAALKYLEDILRLRSLKTLQCLGMMGEYSLLTPTRTAAFYIVGLGLRLCQALGFHEEKSIIRGKDGNRADFLKIDMRRRLFWCFLVMEFGLSHSLGRPSTFAMSQENFDVDWFVTVSDEYITPNGVMPNAPLDNKKWRTIHFFKMRLLQLEIRRKLYQKRQPTPVDDQDPWFKQMEKKLADWRDITPPDETMAGLSKTWFLGRYNTMIVFLLRPSPQVPRPSTRAALLAFNASFWNIRMQRLSIDKGHVDMTWIFTQSICMAVNTILWTLSYGEVRRQNPKEKVEQVLEVGMEAIGLASERWPGVNAAKELYENLIKACLKIYGKEGDVSIAAASPESVNSTSGPPSPGQSTNPTTVSPKSISTPPEEQSRFQESGHPPAQATRHSESISNFSQRPPDLPQYHETAHNPATVPGQISAPSRPGFGTDQTSQFGSMPNMNHGSKPQYNQLPNTFNDLTAWDQLAVLPLNSSTNFNPNMNLNPSTSRNDPFAFEGALQPGTATAAPARVPAAALTDAQYAELLNPNFWASEEGPSSGLNQLQQDELMQSLRTHGISQVESMVEAERGFWIPSQTPYGSG